ncbi:MAG TPA: polysaccharide ABC transporter ATP-binding protein [Chitinophagaceae bacterium]|nr:polysaccharide ABC transporter ATP-binding protein [Chitinophagaceae bacterium]
MNTKNLAIKVEHLSKVYNLGEIGTGTISRDLERWWARIRGKEDPFLKIGESNDRTKKGGSIVYSLSDVNFEIEQGSAVGIIGRNGAGKSTLLKILSRVTSPTAGKIYLNGRVASLLEVGTGFNPELTGRENIFLNGAILGMKKKEIARKFDEIVDFAAVERYIDTPVKRYSSGMYVRLAFAVAAHLECEILIVDEVLAVGDAEFQRKCLGKMGGVMHDEGRTILFVSHDMNAVSKLCTKALMMDKGAVVQNGNVNDVITSYLNINAGKKNNYEYTGDNGKAMYFKKVSVVNENGDPCNSFYIDQPIFLSFEFGINDPDFRCDLFLTVLDSKKRRVFSCEANKVEKKMLLKIEPWQLTRGNYSIETFLNIPHVMKVQHIEDTCDFSVIDQASNMMKHGNYDYGVVLGKYQWS